MIKALRRRFVITTMGILFVLYAVIFTVLNVSFTQTEVQNSYSMMRRAAMQESTPRARPDQPNPGQGLGEDREQGQFIFRPSANDSLSVTFSELYTVKLDSDKNILSATSAFGTDMASDSDLKSIISKVLSLNMNQGKTGSYRFYRETKSYGSVLIIADTHLEDASSLRLLWTSLSIGAAGLVLLFLISVYLSRFVTKPAEETFNKQRQFISDASHELKTPLSVISVNADVLSSEIGQNKWLDYIKSEAGRMDKLIRQLLDLARMDDMTRPRKAAVFNLSDALYETLLPFESTAFERHIEYNLNIKENCYINGEIDGLKQLAAIILDNAFKHTTESGTVSVKLEPREGKAVFEVYNTGDGISPEDLPHVFERFYRGDKSRTGGDSYGLGLSIAQSIAASHGGIIKAESEFGKWARFIFTLPIKI